jgi:hypothetical protein
MVIGMPDQDPDAETQFYRLVRSGAEPPEMALAVQRSKPFGAAVDESTSRGGCVTLVTTQHEGGPVSYVGVQRATGTPITNHVVTSLSSAVGATAEESECPAELSSTPEVGWLIADPRETASRDTQAGNDANEVAILLAQIMRPGDWVAITLRSPTKSEVRRSRRWILHRIKGDESSVHYSNTGEPIVGSVMAGARSHQEVASILSQLAAAIPGFDIETRTPKVPSGIPTRLAVLLTAVSLVGAAVFSSKWFYGVAAAVAVLVAWFATNGYLGQAREMSAALTSVGGGVLPNPPKRKSPPRKPSTKTQTFEKGNRQANLTAGGSGVNHSRKTTQQTRTIDRPGGYPLADASFLFAPSMVIGMVSPHAGTASGMANTASRSVPQSLLENIGPVVGYVGDSREVSVHLDAGELYSGVVMFGIPGSGKTVAIQNLWAWNTLERVRPSGRPSMPGRRNSLIAFESKGEGANEYHRWSTQLGDSSILVEVGNPASPAIDFMDPSMTPIDRANFFISAMIYAFGPDAIGDRSSEVLAMVLPAAVLCPPQVAAATVGLTGEPVSFISIAHTLLGGMGDEAGVAVDTGLSEYLAAMDDFDPAKRDLAVALRSLDPLYGPKVTPTQRRALSESSRNKIHLLSSVPHWWAPTRPRGTWSEVLENHRSVVFNSGITTSGVLVDERLSAVISAMSAFALRDAIQRTCSGWLQQQRSVTVFSDELALLVKSSADVIEWLRDAGRSYGVRLMLASQRPAQLPEAVRSTLRGFGTTLWFQQSDPQVIAEAVAQLSIGGTPWSSADIGNLSRYQAILRATASGRVQTPVPVQMAYWGDDVAEFVRSQSG